MGQLPQRHLHKQRGVTITALIIALVVVVFMALLAFKLIPAFLEYRSMKGAISFACAAGVRLQCRPG